jgi:hypothetical protein
MLDDFTLKVLVSFVVAGSWITLATVISEKFGTKIGGLLANTPSNILVSLFFIGWTQGPQFAAETAKASPIGMAIDTLFLFVYLLAVGRWGVAALIPALASWAVFALLLGPMGGNGIAFTSAVYAAVALACFFYLEKKMRIQSVERGNAKHSAGEIVMRAVFSGTVVASAIIIAKVLGPVWGGVFSVFPATMISSMYLITKVQGQKFAQAFGKSMVLGSANIVVYAAAVAFTYPVYGIVAGTAISYAAAMLFVLAAYPFIKRMK